MRRENERGAIVVEATISLFAFVFVIFTILSVVNICYIQAKMSVALNSAAKEISQYSYLYYKFGINEIEAEIGEATEEARNVATSTITGVSALVDTLSDTQNSIESNEFDKIIPELENAGKLEDARKEVNSLVTMYAEQLSDDPKGFIIGMGKMALNELGENAKALLGQLLANCFVEKNLKAHKGDDPDQFLRRHGVVEGKSGLDFNYTSLMAYGKSNQIQLVVTYDVQVIKLLNIDFKYTFRQAAQTTAWGNGERMIQEKEWTPGEGESVWDGKDTERGKIIVSSEKEKYQYISSGSGYHAYNKNSNEFVKIRSVNTHDDSNQSVQDIKGILSSEYSQMYSKVEDLDETFNVQDKNGNSVAVTSDPNTRKYRIVLVIPDDADMATVRKAVDAFIQERKDLGDDVSVDIVTDYGHPTKKDKKEEES